MASSLPLLEWLPDYRKTWLRADVVAGLTTSAVVIPKAMAYATIAGLPIQVGLYMASAPMVIYAVLGTERMMFDLEIAVDRYQQRREGSA